jgi:hypothetical protein
MLIPARVLLGLYACLVFAASTSGQEVTPTAEQIIDGYIQALGGADKIAAISTFSERGEILTNGFGPHVMVGHWRFESYFKAPNLRATVTFGEKGVDNMQGCDGKLAWYIGPTGRRFEIKPKPEKEYTCTNGFSLLPFLTRRPEIRIQLKGKKKIGGRTAWEIRASDSKASFIDTFYFDAETHLLLQSRTHVSYFGFTYESDLIYSDYRDVGGIKFPFTQVMRTETSATTTTVGELTINVPIDDARFAEPTVRGRQAEQPVARAIAPPAPTVVTAPKPDQTAPPGAALSEPKITELRIDDSKTTAPKITAPPITYVNAIKYISCSIHDLQQAVPELGGLKPDENQNGLTDLLDKIGARTVELRGKSLI